MKTPAKITFTLIISMIISISAKSQNTYLKISEDDKTSISYPPESKFTLTDSNGYVVLKNTSKPLLFKIDKAYKLEVFPSYKIESDVYNLTNGKIEVVSNADYLNAGKHKKGAFQSYGVSLDKTSYIDSSVKKGETNVVLEFSNGVIFKYKDGKITATLNNKEVEVKGHYLIYSDSGVVKISYNPKNKELWWTYEPANK